MEIIQADPRQYEPVRLFYHALIDASKVSPYDIGWEKDIYPAPEFLRKSIDANELYLGLDGADIAAAMVLNHQYNEGYRKFSWPTDADDSEVAVIHALGVHPSFSGRGYAKAMVKKAMETAAEAGVKVIRLDVLSGNIPAERLYSGMGFRYMDTIQMYYEDTGWTDYRLYEYVL